MPSRPALNTKLPSTAVKFASSVSAGSATSSATKRWTTRNRTGLMAMVSSARISSETFIVPIRAVNGGSHPGSDDHGRDERTHFAEHRYGHEAGDVAERAHLLQLERDEHGNGHAEQRGDRENERQGLCADLVDLVQDAPLIQLPALPIRSRD